MGRILTGPNNGVAAAEACPHSTLQIAHGVRWRIFNVLGF